MFKTDDIVYAEQDIYKEGVLLFTSFTAYKLRDEYIPEFKYRALCLEANNGSVHLIKDVESLFTYQH